VKTDDGVTLIVWAPKYLFKLDVGKRQGDCRQSRFGLLQGLLALIILCQLKVDTSFFEIGLVPFPVFQDVFQRSLFLKNNLRLFAVTPKIWPRAYLV
jgi:hypothetical protein